MRSQSLTRLILFSACLFTASFATAQASRTWVSGVGDDANPCSRTAPCKTFAGAISKTAAGGEIDALDPAGYGAVTIIKSITIDGGGGQVASILVSGTNGINVNAGANDVVILRNLRFQGLKNSGSGGLNGINYLNALSLIVEDCYIDNFNFDGIYANAPNGSLTVRRTSILNTGNAGIEINQTTWSTIEDTTLASGVHGLETSSSFVTATRTNASQNTNNGFYVKSGELNLFSSTSANNDVGVNATGGSTRLALSTVTDNAKGLYKVAGNIYSYGNNYIAGNTTTVTPTAIAPQ